MQTGSVADKAEQEKQELEKQFKGKDSWMARVLERREQRDEQASKQMIKATIEANAAGHHDNNNW